jgi:hypothetical protein
MVEQRRSKLVYICGAKESNTGPFYLGKLYPNYEEMSLEIMKLRVAPNHFNGNVTTIQSSSVSNYIYLSAPQDS